MVCTEKLIENIQEYYGTVLRSNRDLQTNACCCSAESMPEQYKAILREIHDEIIEKFYGCGSPIPPALEGCRVLDLGCGTGRDVYLASRLVGSKGHVIGVDMTDGQLEVARRHLDDQMRRFGFEDPNVSFKKGYIEDLAVLGIDDDSIDVVISNCVLNLSPDKSRAFSEILRVLRPGGELYFSDVFAMRRVPEALRRDPVLRGECLAGALYVEDFRRLMASLGCPDYRVTASCPISIDNPEIERKIGMIDFYSLTVRAFKLDSLEDRCEDYGQVAYYDGTIPAHPHRFELDDHHVFEKDRPVSVCGNTAAMLEETRLGSYFRVSGDRSVHFGLFDCEPGSGGDGEDSAGSCC